MFDTKLLFALTLYISAIFMSNLLGLKTMPFIFGTHITFAVFTLPLIFVTTDVIGKIYGKDMAKRFVFLGFFSIILWIIFSLFSQLLPWSAQTYARVGEAYETIFSLSIRISMASLCAFFASEYLDVLVFFRFKNQKSTFWMASFFSNLVSQLLDTVIFMTIAFLGFYDIEKILMMALPLWIYKVSMGVMYMPFSYLALNFLSKRKDE
jgi:queuosine precursor transporter